MAIGKGKNEFHVLFQEYAKAFKGRHQLEWSKDLWKLLEMGKKVTDEDLAGRLEEEAEFLGRIDPPQWKIIQKAEKRGEVLEVAHREGWPGVLKLIKTLIGEYGAANEACQACKKVDD
jgi:hypothetical protein